MFRRFIRALRYTLILLRAWPRPARRRLLRRMLAFSRALPQQFNRPLPAMMAHLTPAPQAEAAAAHNGALAEPEIRQLADAVAAWQLRSPLGICLRRSLLRYYFLREAGLPVKISFGARLKSEQEGSGLGGHAWLTLNGRAYYEPLANYEGFVVMYSYPPDHEPAGAIAPPSGSSTALERPA